MHLKSQVVNGLRDHYGVYLVVFVRLQNFSLKCRENLIKYVYEGVGLIRVKQCLFIYIYFFFKR